MSSAFTELSECYQANKLCRNACVRFVPVTASIEDAILADDDDARFVVDLSNEHLPTDARSRGKCILSLSDCSSTAENMDELMDPAPEPEIPIKLRPYQDELATFALQGKNTVVCAPTGSGKTIVAVKIINEHLLEGERMKQKRKVCFLVPSTVLVEQQEKLISCYLKHKWEVKGLSGSETAPKVPTVRSAHVIVITPQLIV